MECRVGRVGGGGRVGRLEVEAGGGYVGGVGGGGVGRDGVGGGGRRHGRRGRRGLQPSHNKQTFLFSKKIPKLAFKF